MCAFNLHFFMSVGNTKGATVFYEKPSSKDFIRLAKFLHFFHVKARD